MNPGDVAFPEREGHAGGEEALQLETAKFRVVRELATLTLGTFNHCQANALLGVEAVGEGREVAHQATPSPPVTP